MVDRPSTLLRSRSVPALAGLLASLALRLVPSPAA